MSRLDALFAPRSVAMVGASADATRIGGRALRHLKECGFTGAIYPVNPGRNEVQGLTAYRTVDDIIGAVDAAVLALPTDAVLPAIEACARKGVGAAVIFSAGFAEMGAAGVAAQEEIMRISRGAGMRVLGPNCLGMYNMHAGSYLSFSGVFEDVRGTAGRLGLVSQSGGYAGEVVKAAKNLGLDFGIWITTGNEADIGLGEAMQYLAESDDIDVVGGYIEGVRDRDAFFRALEAAHARRKPVVVLKVGRTEQGARAAASHTASLAGSDGVYDAVFHHYGVYRARTTEEMLDVAYAASRGRFAAGNRIAILTNSGGIGVQASDFAADEALDVAPMPDAVQDRLREISPNGSPFNPVDLTGQVANDPPMYARAVDAVLQGGAFDMAYLNIGLIAGIPFIARPLVENLADMAQRHSSIPLAASVTAPRAIVAEYEAAGYLCYQEPARAIKALAALATFPAAWGQPLGRPDLFDDVPILARGQKLSEAASKTVIAQVGVRSPPEYLVRTAEAARSAALSLARPVAIKVVSPDIVHKTEVGGVALNVDPAQAGEQLVAMAVAVGRNAPEAHIEGYLVTPMHADGVECIVGVHSDPVLGPVVMFGLGGVTVELMKDVTSRLAPVDEVQAQAMIRAVKGFPLLDGFRGRPRADIDALARAIVGISRLAAANANSVKTIEINPLLVLDAGDGVVALDAVIETQD